MTENQAHIAYNILVLYAGVHPESREEFVAAVTRPKGCREYRFQGSLGFGGKIYFCQQAGHAHCYIQCYAEDDTPERLVIIERCNSLLALL